MLHFYNSYFSWVNHISATSPKSCKSFEFKNVIFCGDGEELTQDFDCVDAYTHPQFIMECPHPTLTFKQQTTGNSSLGKRLGFENTAR